MGKRASYKMKRGKNGEHGLGIMKRIRDEEGGSCKWLARGGIWRAGKKC